MSSLLLPSSFDATVDAAVLRKAMKGLGTNEKEIIGVLGHRTYEQRSEIRLAFNTVYGKDLGKELDSETSGNFKKLLRALLQERFDLEATQIRSAMRGLGTNEDAVIGIICTKNNSEITQLTEAYHRKFRKNLEKDIVSETSGFFKRVLVSLLQANRSENDVADEDTATRDAQTLYAAGEGKWGTDESTFNTMLATRSAVQLLAISREYKSISKRSLLEAIKSETSGDLRKAYITIVSTMLEPATYFAQSLIDSMWSGTDNDKLIRLVVTRCEIDMEDIKTKVFELSGKTLHGWIKGDASGDYKKLLLELCGNEYSQ